MASSRIFVKSLPPTFTDDEFRKHFSENGKREITDAKLFPKRRIGYVGFRTQEEAEKAVKYFNKTFIRMSRIGVEIATPIDETTVFKGRTRAPTSKKETGDNAASAYQNNLKRKRAPAEPEVNDPKLKEFLEVMRPRSTKKAWENGDVSGEVSGPSIVDAAQHSNIAEGESDDEYQQVPKKSKTTIPVSAPENATERIDEDVRGEDTTAEATEHEESGRQENVPRTNGAPTSDADWARSKTSRLLDLLDEGEEIHINPTPERKNSPDHASDREDEQDESSRDAPTVAAVGKSPQTTSEEPAEEAVDTDVETVRSTMRLFLRNLPYDIKNEDLEAEFGAYGNLEEVSLCNIFF